MLRRAAWPCTRLAAVALACGCASAISPATRTDGGTRDASAAARTDSAIPIGDPCAAVVCPRDRLCIEGSCVLDGSCDGITCTRPDERCVAGRGCVPGEADEDGDGVKVRDGDCDDRDAMIHPGAPERCNAIDDDCDSMTDEGNPGGGGRCATGLAGPCATGTDACQRGAIVCIGETAPGEETCNGVDDDCNGHLDDGDPGGGGGCDTGMSGPCGPGRTTCRAAELVCAPMTMPAMETCNGVDDDCDGTVDDGVRIEVVSTDFSALSAQHGGCDGPAAGIDACNAAVKRFCDSRSSCWTGGFGPSDATAGSATVTCVTGGTRLHVTDADMTGAQPPCTGGATYAHDVCLTAAYRLCRSRGHTAGFGPVEHAGGGADIVCLDRGDVVDVPYSTLAAIDSDCSESTALSFACNTAIRRFCADRSGGRASGFGPVEHSGGTASVVCLDP